MRETTPLKSWLPALAAALLASTAVPASAEIPPELVGQPVTEISIAGETAAIVALRDIGIPLGAPLNRALVRKTITRLLATGRWTNVQVDAQPLAAGVKLIFRLTPRIVLHRLNVTGNTAVDEAAIREALRVGRGSEVVDEQLEQFELAISRLYASRGYFGARIEVGLRDTDDPALKVLMIDIEEGVPTRLRRIRFAGERPLDPTAVRNAMGIAAGDVLDRRRLSQGVTRAEAYLRSHGYLEAHLEAPILTVQGINADVQIPSRIGPRYRVVIEGHEPLSREEVYEVLGIDKERLTRTMLEATLADRTLDLYARHGFVDTKVAVERRRGRAKNTATLLLHIEPGKQLRVVAVSFAGARHFSRDFLRDQLYSYLIEDLPGSTLAAPVDAEVADEILYGQPITRKREVPAPLDLNPEQTYYEDTYKEAIAHIVELYQGEGFLSARVGPPDLRRIGADRAAVIVPVVEGPRTLLHEVVLSGAQVLSPRELLSASGLHRNQPFSYLKLEQARLSMLELYHERGYMFAKVDPSVRMSRDHTRAEVSFQIVERYPVYVDRIVVEGADRTSDALILRAIKLEPGDVFRPSVARESERQLSLLGVFTGVSVKLEDPELPAQVKSVKVTVSERRNQFLDFSAGLSTGQGVRAGFEYGYRNLFGEAVGVTLRTQFAYQLFFVDDEFERRFEALEGVDDQLERRISLGVTVPRLPGLGGVRTSVDLVHLRDNERDFGLDKNGVGLTFSHSPLQYVTATLGGDYENNNVDLFVSGELEDYLIGQKNPRLRRLLRVPEGASTLVAARTSLSYDKRDSPFTPTRGYFVTGNAELATTLTTEQPKTLLDEEDEPFVSRFVKVSASGSGYLPIGRGFIIAGQARAGRIMHLTKNSKTYPNRAFFLGGVDTIRGFLEDELMPQDVAERVIADPELNPDSVVRSGDAFILLRGELRFPIYEQLQGGVFSDMGNLWADADNLRPFDLRPTAGLGLRIATPVGPLAVDYGFNLLRRGALKERSGALHFSIGLF